MHKHTGTWLLSAALVLSPVVMTTAVQAGTPASKPMVKQSTVQVKLSVNGMFCSSCEPKVKKAAMAVAGVKSCAVNHERNEAVVTYDPAKTKIDQVVASLKKAGFKASLKKV